MSCAAVAARAMCVYIYIRSAHNPTHAQPGRGGTMLVARRRPLGLWGGRALSSAASSGSGGGNSGSSVTFPNVRQGGSLHVRIQRVPIQIKIKSAWVDHTELSVEAPASAPALEVTETGPTGQGGGFGALEVSDAKLNFAPNALLALSEPYRLTATVPEKFNLQLRVQSTGLRHGAILTREERAAKAPVVEIASKVEGDVEVFARHGDVRVGKLRGPRIELGAEHGCVFVDKYVEGDVSIRAQRLHARMIKGSRIRVQVSYPGGQPAPPPPAPEGYKPSMEATEASSTIKEEEEPAPVTVEALFGNRASVLCTALGQGERARRAVDITRSHGDVKVVVTGGGVQLGGVNGSATVQTVDGPLDVRFEALAPGTSNTLTTRRGTVGLLMAPEIKAELVVEGLSQRPESLTPEGPNGFAVTAHMGSRLEGRFTGASPPKSRKSQQQEQQHQHDASPPPSTHGKGKIDLSGAEAQALKSFFTDRAGGKDGGKEGTARLLQPAPKEPSILVKLGGGQLSVRTISWMDAIKRQFGLGHIDYSAPPKA